MRFLPVTPERAVELSFKLAKLIKESGYKFDVIVSIHRGGMVISRLLSDYLDVRDIRAIRVEHYSAVEKGESARVVEPISRKFNGEKVLLVDDVADTGESLRVAKEYLLSMGASEVRIATLHYKPWSSVKPEYFVEQTDRWVVYFWERAETAKYLRDKLKRDGICEAEINRILEEEAGIPDYIIDWVTRG